ncbi:MULTISPECIES: ribonuclease activity regulator RraA [unclassified Streptomyces]|uniref:RraA family protein n=1 Tax=unclassified Streptomyces TaxID=2593676 RepID=UPI0022536B4F|nr:MULTISPECIES: ribonuclease activity regulator RraA [unclassified Streptomyces]WSP59389.1 ribonuclease activity regulator RraA [Streptomyces sp. NBC_01241]WSU20093.1 ribonuclease activity regulator RraA [Streptomyces sp. NBC_01108]MCX4791151.1 ribonuclease activity regulator RraA [Streptomyces sp. NBC_01221]MCX4793131.1 ribonuclease activity regulator RraA [Streptomyces sp. NBC_01242]WSP61020.1 ribonuclease activity regulator RraA [Streptomyces sp. NBC_01240]
MTTDEQAQPVFPLPVRGDAYQRADAELVGQMGQVSSATACAKLHGMGIRRTWMEGPQPLATGQKIAGSALTLQFMPQREDIASGLAQEAVERQTALWAVLEAVQPGDVLVIQAYGSAFSGCVGDMLVRYFKRKGGAGIVVDGRIRDAPRIRELGVPIWCTGTTPHYASQSELFPWAYDVPVAAGGVLCLPGDIVVADDDGAVVVPQATAPEVVATAQDHQEWEVFSRMRLDQGAKLGNYYPLTSESRAEYEQWRDQQRSSQR